ncbi:MAG: hypothetical protein AAF191_18970 [Verrucomicrobiota bacterium]
MLRIAFGWALVLLWWSFAFALEERQLAFPGAEGWGRFAIGGRGGRVVEVTNLRADGPGSFKAAVEGEGSRTVVFRVGGTIDLKGKSVRIRHPYLTIAGQTAPGEGVLLRNGQIILIETHDVIVRHLRVRPGPDVPTPASSQTVTADGTNTGKAMNVIVDHCSLGWATDDTAGCCGARNVTYQWCLLSEGLNVSEDPKSGIYGKGFVVGAGAENISLVNNVLAHFKDRAPQTSSHRTQIVNNLIYNVRGDSNVFPRRGPIDVAFLDNHYCCGVSVP